MRIIVERDDADWLEDLIRRVVREELQPVRDREQEWLTLQEVAKIARVKEQTLRSWRHSGKNGPPSIRRGRRVLYKASDLYAWMESNT